MPPIIGITIGDINGIGPELIIKTLRNFEGTDQIPLLIGPEKVLCYYLQKMDSALPYNVIRDIRDISSTNINILDTIQVNDPVISPGIQTAESGRIAMLSIEHAIKLCVNRSIDAMVTAPISKEAVNLAGYSIPGHTEFLAERTGTEEVLMMLVNDGLRVALVTTHVPVREIAKDITENLIIHKARILDQSLRMDFRIKKPKIALFGLNPHAGDGGVIGNEEIEIIKPAIKRIKAMGINAEGPFPADGFFGQKAHNMYDAILAMYHDQGLIPFKLLSFGSGVNFTAGLPIIRTSPDHGTAFNIAGKGIADPSSFIKAYDLAIKLAKNREITDD